MKYRWSDLDSENDRYGIKKCLGEKNLALELAWEFEGTSPKVWGNILKGRETSGTYGEIICLIKYKGFKGASNGFRVGTKAKIKSLRHYQITDE
jgi:hypothetical protein